MAQAGIMGKTGFLFPGAVLSALALALVSCAPTPKPMVRYRTAETPGDLWKDGLNLHGAETRRLRFATAFLELARDPVRGYSDPRSLTFLIAALNSSHDTSLLGPGMTTPWTAAGTFVHAM
jgi:hypothetical protein